MNLSLREIADQFDLELIGEPSTSIRNIASLEHAKRDELAFLFNSSHKIHLKASQAGAVVIRPSDSADCEIPMLLSDQPRLAWANIATLFDRTPQPDALCHGTAVISPTAQIGADVSIGANTVVESGVMIADGVVIGAGCFVGEGVEIGAGSRLHANVTIYHDVQLGENTVVHSGSIIGADGFGYEFNPQTASLVKIPQVYGVRIGDNVEIGAGSTIDRGALNHTIISDGVKLDNQVQIGHGTNVGAHTVMCGCSAVAGSTTIGAYCLIGGAVGIIDNLEIADHVEITAMSLVSQSIPNKGRYSSGTGLMPGRDWKRNIVGFRKLDDIIKRLRLLEKKDKT